VSSSDQSGCGDLTPDIGIVGTPVIDPSSNTLYVVARSKNGTTFHQRLHALDLATGAEKFSGPTDIQATVNGTGTVAVAASSTLMCRFTTSGQLCC